jgi:uncharacterized protein YfaS (alpha-2-macroglobulin family)
MRPVVSPPTKGSIRITFNLPVNADDARKYMTIDPAVDHRMTSRHHYLELEGDFEIGRTYRVTIDRGLPAIDGSTLDREFSSAVSFPREDIPPQIDFVGDGFYLTKSGNLNLGLSTINVDSVSVEIEQVFANNLVYLLNAENLVSSRSYYRSRSDMRAVGRHVHAFDIMVDKNANQEVVTPIDAEEYLAGDAKGVFRFTARRKARRWQTAKRWVIATDMGIVAKKAGDDLWVWVNSLSTLEPVEGAKLTLYSRNNQELMAERTDRDGLAVFESYKDLNEGFEPYLVTASHENDLSFLEITRRLIPTSDFDVAGSRLLQSGYEAFMYGERDIYRPGEAAQIVAIVRGVNAIAPEPFPVRMRLRDPGLKIISEQRAMLNDQGAAEFECPIPEYAKTGVYNAELLLGDRDRIGQRKLQVEEFVPDRMKVKITTDLDSYRTGETMAVSVEAVTLFGPPASGRRVKADIEVETFPFTIERWKAFTFSDARKSFSAQRFKLGEGTLDDDGKADYVFEIPDNFEPPASLRGVLSATVLEPGGRGVTAYSGVLIHPHSTYVGLRRTETGYAEPNKPVEHQFVVVDPDGKPVPGCRVEVSFYRVYWQSILRRVDSRTGYRYVSEKVEDLIDQFTLESTDQAAAFSVTPGDFGRYLVVVRDVESNAGASYEFYASGWGYCPWAMDEPDRIEIDLDKELYSPGETAQIQIRAPFPGKLLLTLENRGVLDHKILTLTDNTATVGMPVTDDCKPNAYVSAHLIRSTEALQRDTPVRAFGVVPLPVNNEANLLTIEFDAPTEARPKTSLAVNFKVAAQSRGTPLVTIAAVDEGICQLTDFRTPDPHGFFFGKKRHSVDSYDMYSLILPEIESSLSAASGDVESARRRHITPVSVRRVKPVALWSGFVEIDERGFGKVTFELPQFNGTVRLMAVAFDGDRFGSNEQKVVVREPIVLTPTFPRFIASADSLIVPVTVFNGTGEDAQFDVRLRIDGPVEAVGASLQSVTIAQGKEETVDFRLKAHEAAGKVKFDLIATGAAKRTEMQVEVPVRPPVPYVTLSGAGSVQEGSAVSFTFPSEFIEGSARFALSIASSPEVRFARSLQYLLSYPHGCVEQTTSRLFPLLYFDELARLAEPELFERNSADYYIEEGITKLENMQLISGTFAFWPQGNYISNWASIYASHFLVEARRAGYTVSDRVYNGLIRALAASSRDYRDGERHSFEKAVYACYVLALAGKPESNTMHYLKDNALDKLSDYSQYQMAGAFALSGDLNTARTLLPGVALPETVGREPESGGNFNSSVRAKAIMLGVLADFDDKNPMIPQLIKDLTDAASERGRWRTTQENAFAFLALGKIMKTQPDADYSGNVTIDGSRGYDFDTGGGRYSSRDWSGKEVTVEIAGSGTCYYYWRADGLPSGLHIDEHDDDVVVRRRYLDENGNAMDYESFRQGDLVIAEITLKAPNEPLENVAVVDLLPAGLEIENPRLQSRRGISWIGDKAYKPTYTDIRDDRLIFYGDIGHGSEQKFYYALRAITRGSFILPPVTAEVMYAPMKRSVASSGRVVVNAP